MSTFLISLGVVAAAICVLWIALSDPDQPATLSRPTGRAGPRRQPSPTASPSAVLSPWTRARSAMALMVLVTFTGVVLAALVGTGLALAIRSFTRAVQ